MEQKFRSLGTLLTRESQKRIIGGMEEEAESKDTCKSCTWGDSLPVKQACKVKGIPPLDGCECPGGSSYACDK